MDAIQTTTTIMGFMPREEQEKVVDFAQKLISSDHNNPFRKLTDEEFYESIDRGIAQADSGQVMDMEEAIDKVSAELGI